MADWSFLFAEYEFVGTEGRFLFFQSSPLGGELILPLSRCVCMHGEIYLIFNNVEYDLPDIACAACLFVTLVITGLFGTVDLDGSMLSITC